MVALIALLLIVAVFGGFGFAAHFLWFVLIAALVLWVLSSSRVSNRGSIAGAGTVAGSRPRVLEWSRRQVGRAERTATRPDAGMVALPNRL